MKGLIPKCIGLIAIFLVNLVTTTSVKAEDPKDMPLIMTLKTNIYYYQGPSNYFVIYLGATEDNTEFYIEGPNIRKNISVDRYSIGTDEDGENAAIATAIPLSITDKDNEIRIYGDASKIDYIDAHGCYLNYFELNGELMNLSVIDLSHNELPSIDLSMQSNLNSIDLTDNSFKDPYTMKIGTNHPGLLLLSIGINDVCDVDLDLKNFPNLQYFSARNNYGLFDIDLSNCPDLVVLDVEVTNLSNIDVTKLSNLIRLNVSNTKIKEIDLSKNVALTSFLMNHEGSFNNEDEYKITDIDLSAQSNLQILDLGGNRLSNIDVSNLPNLVNLGLQHNNLSSIDLSNNPNIYRLNLSYNYFNFATLPLPIYPEYYYYRSDLPTNRKYKVGTPIDFSSMVIRAPFEFEGELISPVTYAAVFVAPLNVDPYELDPKFYEYNEGVITFNSPVEDQVYVEFYCDLYPDWPLDTEKFLVLTPEDFDAPETSFTFMPSDTMAGQQISFSLGAISLEDGITLPADVTIFMGSQTITLPSAVKTSSLPDTDNIIFTLPNEIQEVVISLPDGLTPSALSMKNIKLEEISLSNALELKTLLINNAGLKAIDLSYNKNLTELDLSHNELVSLNLKGIRGDFEKNELHDINVSYNNLETFVATEYSVINNLDVSNNNFKDFNLKYFKGLKNLNISSNDISGDLDLSAVTGLQNLDASGNRYNSVSFYINDQDYPDPLGKLVSFNIKDNQFTFATLPQLNSTINYVYVPQEKVSILSNSSSIDLSSQYIGEGNDLTKFVWKFTEDNSIVPVTEYTFENGMTQFGSSLVGKSLYCEMTNPLFPAFDNYPLTTTPVVVEDTPSVLVASFTTLKTGTAEIGFRFADSSKENALYIDWQGNGTELIEYLYPANYSGGIYKSAKTYAGANVKIYSYQQPDNITVFAMNNTVLGDLDVSRISKLEALDIHNAKLNDNSIKLPENSKIWELALDGNNFSNQSFAGLKSLRTLVLGDNKYTTFDLSEYPNLQYLDLSDNQLTSIKIEGNKSLYNLFLTNNQLSEIDLSGCPNVNDVLLADNNLTEIDLSPVSESLTSLVLSGNRFTFATLPYPTNVGPLFNTYYYANQKPMEVECIDGKIDLSSQSSVEGNPTEYLWFLGNKQDDVYYDYNEERYIGELLIGGDESADSNYIIVDGVTTFIYPQNKKVICAMTNSELPNLILYTTPTTVSQSGIETLFENKEFVDVYSLTGILLKKKVSISDAFKGLQKGIYIIDGKKVIIR